MKPLFRLLFFVSIIILLTCCEKQKIKKHYTGNFKFTSISTTWIYGDLNNPYIDTLISNGTIEWVEKTTTIIISFPNEVGSPIVYNLNVDKHGILTLVEDDTYPPNPHLKQSLEGKFVNDDEVNFTKYTDNNYIYPSWDTTVVVGIRL
jgi:hypothetical protein